MLAAKFLGALASSVSRGTGFGMLDYAILRRGREGVFSAAQVAVQGFGGAGIRSAAQRAGSDMQCWVGRRD